MPFALLEPLFDTLGSSQPLFNALGVSLPPWDDCFT